MTKRKITESDGIVAVARAAYEAYVAKDLATIERLIAPDFHFTSRIDNRVDRATAVGNEINEIEAFDRFAIKPDFYFNDLAVAHGDNLGIAEAGSYFGWSIPHEAKPGGFLRSH